MTIKLKDIVVGAKFRMVQYPNHYIIITKIDNHTVYFDYHDPFSIISKGNAPTKTLRTTASWEPVYTVEGFEV